MFVGICLKTRQRFRYDITSPRRKECSTLLSSNYGVCRKCVTETVKSKVRHPVMTTKLDV